MSRADPQTDATHDDESHQHIASPKLYVAIFLGLLVGTALTVAAAFYDFGALGFPIAMAIACVKAVLVVLFFMHVKFEMPLVKLMVPMALAFLAVFFVLIFGDYVSRAWVL